MLVTVNSRKGFLFLIVLATLNLACGKSETERTETGGTTHPISRKATEQVSGETVSELISVTSGTTTFQIFKYEALVTDGSAASKAGVVPTVSINFEAAKAACTKSGYRLCTETEWKTACRGPSDLKHAFSATSAGPPAVAETCDVARTENNTPGSLPSNTGSFPNCKTTGLELYDMIGNASEWVVMTDGTTAKSAGAAFYQTAEDSNCDGELTATGAAGEHMDPTTASTDVGFRCCKD